jgi:sarcosine oxidase, subunit gamma
MAEAALDFTRPTRRQALEAPPLARRGVTIRVLPAEARFSLRLPMRDAEALGDVAEFPTTVAINRYAAKAARWDARLGPNEWLLGGPADQGEAIFDAIESALAGRVYALTDISHRQVAFELAGAEAAAVLNSGCPLDLSTTAFPAGSATRTLLGKVEIVLMRPNETPTFRLDVWRSFAEYAHAFLTEAARDCPALA